MHSLYMTQDNPVDSVEYCSSSGTNILDHPAADGAGLAGGQVTVATALQVDADFGSCLHFEAVHGLTSLGNIDLVAVLRIDSLLLLSSE